MKRLTEHELQNRLGSSLKRKRLRDFRSSLAADRDCRNFDSEIDREIQKYLVPSFDYLETKEYLRDLKSSKDGKYFSQGVKEYSLMLQGLTKFTEPNHPSFQWNENYQAAKRSLMNQFSSLRLSELVYDGDDSIVQALPKLDTHSGFTYLETGLRHKGENLDGIFEKYVKQENQARHEGSFNKPILPGCRTQGSGAFDDEGCRTGDCKHKTRVISMVDMYVILAELKFASPIQSAMAEMHCYAGGKDPKQISRIISNMRSNYRSFISLDYSAFDQSISDWLIYDAFEILKSAFLKVDDELYSIVVEDFIHKNFITDSGVLYSRKGVPSGSMFTQIIDSVVNILMVTTYLKSIGTSGDMIVMGDDNLLYVKGDVEVDKISSYITKNFGVVVNSDKTSFGSRQDDPEFLSRYWRYNGQWREPHTVIAKALYPERFRNYKTGKVNASMIIYALILTYPLTMPKIIDVDRFLYNHPNLKKSYILNNVDYRYLPGALAYLRDYTRTKDVA